MKFTNFTLRYFEKGCVAYCKFIYVKTVFPHNHVDKVLLLDVKCC